MSITTSVHEDRTSSLSGDSGEKYQSTFSCVTPSNVDGFHLGFISLSTTTEILKEKNINFFITFIIMETSGGSRKSNLGGEGGSEYVVVLHDWCNKGCGLYYPVCGMVHIKVPLLLIEKSSPCGGSGFPLSLSEWSFTICLMPYNRK